MVDIDPYLIIRTLHIISSTIVFGTGVGIAFFMFRSYFGADHAAKLYAVRTTVLADYIFTLPAVIIQPVTGFWLVWQVGYDWTVPWLVITYVIYAIAGACWLPVVWIQIELKKILESVSEKTDLPERYHSLFKIWFILGCPAFIGLVAVFFLMVMKPV
ncbi:DUF2269 family protein [Paremcibacter congregatus]|uniref:DUF2269 domain-containing protein n=1 Tax=Paremcibacter congregatus TaxID=2043170 RepID=A0A2G4YV64_9PROT|nr:DUF2269 domain-containing protein [Paremcibacter congregatus]PHZ85336.1 hypothetical protein CRD36_08015 [Paremcibacter congregatus]QDE27733.1 DUF2269 domain-containing protein [Paremcibacter congregatus]